MLLTLIHITDLTLNFECIYYKLLIITKNEVGKYLS